MATPEREQLNEKVEVIPANLKINCHIPLISHLQQSAEDTEGLKINVELEVCYVKVWDINT